MARRNDHSREELEKLILSTAWRLIEEQGVEAVTARAIAKAIGYTPGTIYNLFNSMDDIYLHLNARTLDLLHATLTACMEGCAPAVNRIKDMAHCYMAFSQEHCAQWRMLFTLKVTNGRDDVDWYHHKVERMFAPLEELMRAYFPQEADTGRKEAARILWASVHGLCVLQDVDKVALIGNGRGVAELLDYMVDTFVSGMPVSAT